MTIFANLARIGRNLVQEIEASRRIMADPRTPRLARVLLGLAVAYAVSPVDLVPDFIPVLGHVDDVIIVPLLIVCGLRLVPPEIVSQHRAACKSVDGG